VKQPQQVPLAAAAWTPKALPLDVVRLEQFLDLQRHLLTATEDADTLPERLAQRVAIFLGVAGAAIGIVEDGTYRVLATYGLDPSYHGRYHGLVVRDSALAPALASGRPLVLAEPETAGRRLQTLLLPFHAADVTGALHLVPAPGRTLAEQDLQLARTFTAIAGVALANAWQCRRLTRLARLRGDALTAMAHDLRAPLNALVGYTSLLGEGAFGPLTDEQREVSAALGRQAIELVDLMGATLDVARLETGRLPVRLEEVDLHELLATLAAGTFAQATRNGLVAWRPAADVPRFRSDRVKVKEILQNLVDNALKHGERRLVEVDAESTPDRDAVRLVVRDAGAGIPADVLPHLFEPFRPGRTGGTGFGLYLVRSFTEALGGRVTARSHPGAGTTITVELPLVAPQA
jgi:signal transduction histidine kinase